MENLSPEEIEIWHEMTIKEGNSLQVGTRWRGFAGDGFGREMKGLACPNAALPKKQARGIVCRSTLILGHSFSDAGV